MRITVAIITRNRAPFLRRALKAVEKLTYPNYEVVVVDNGSTDETPEIARSFDIHYIRGLVDDGIAGSRRRAFDAARGEIVAMCDDDCVPAPNWLQPFARRFREEPELALLGGRVLNIGFPGRQQYKGQTRLEKNGVLSFAETLEETDFFGNLNLAVRAEPVRAVGGYDPFLKAGLEEIDLAVSLLRAGYRIDAEPAAVVEHHFTGVGYKRGRWLYDRALMRLYFFFKHFRPRNLSEWAGFALEEMRLWSRDLMRSLRFLGAAMWRRRLSRLPAAWMDLINLNLARWAIPWLLLRTRTPHLPRQGREIFPGRA